MVIYTSCPRGKVRNKTFLEKNEKSLKKCLTKLNALWYYRQALAEEGGSTELKLGKKQIKNGIRKK